jgi:hypothetical protein
MSDRPPILDLNDPPLLDSITDPIQNLPVQTPHGPGKTIGVGNTQGEVLAYTLDGDVSWVSPTKPKPPNYQAEADLDTPEEDTPFSPLTEMDAIYLGIPREQISIPINGTLDPGWKVTSIQAGKKPEDIEVELTKREIDPNGKEVTHSKRIRLGELYLYLDAQEKARKEASITPEQKEREAQLKKVFAPPKTKKDPEEAQDYSFLFDEQLPQSTSPEKASRKDPEEVRPITAESVKAASKAIEEALVLDCSIQSILAKHSAIPIQNLRDTAKQKIEHIRLGVLTNPDLRLDLAKHYLKRFESLALRGDLPERVGRSTSKALPYKIGDIRNLSSNDYVALLCLSMLDGTFLPEKEDSGGYDWQKRTGVGQHRAAARRILFNR